MIGDRIESDLAGAAAAGLDGAIVLTGVSTRADADAARKPAPVAIAENLSSLVTRSR
jgi:ribonucleotide monophosphatase NagD (HAD superfamily)